MKLYKRVLCTFLAAVMLFSCVSLFATADGVEYKNNSPFIFVHGLNGWGSGEGINGVMPYWGATTGDLMEYLRGEGYECYSCSVGPLNSAWDRACELYAQLVGGRVDYGEAHSAAHNHARYGRTYDTALVPNWGELSDEGKIKKIHLIGHSFGGTAIRVFSQLMCEGSAEEIAATAPDELSGLFTGGKSSWIESLTTICTPHNSTAFYYLFSNGQAPELYLAFTYSYASIAGRTHLNGTYFDFHLEQYGLTDIPGYRSASRLIPSLKSFLNDPDDSAQYDLVPEGCNRINEWVDTNDDIYYFSYAYSTTRALGSLQLPISTTNPALVPFAAMMGVMPTFNDEASGFVMAKADRANDGLVSTNCALYPKGEAHTQYDPESITKGVWNVMPVREGDHGTPIGLFSDADVTHEYYDGMLAMLNALD